MKGNFPGGTIKQIILSIFICSCAILNTDIEEKMWRNHLHDRKKRI